MGFFEGTEGELLGFFLLCSMPLLQAKSCSRKKYVLYRIFVLIEKYTPYLLRYTEMTYSIITLALSYLQMLFLNTVFEDKIPSVWLK